MFEDFFNHNHKNLSSVGSAYYHKQRLVFSSVYCLCCIMRVSKLGLSSMRNTCSFFLCFLSLFGGVLYLPQACVHYISILIRRPVYFLLWTCWIKCHVGFPHVYSEFLIYPGLEISSMCCFVFCWLFKLRWRTLSLKHGAHVWATQESWSSYGKI